MSRCSTRGNRNDIGRPSALNALLIESYEFEGNDDAPNPVQTKSMMRTLGHAVGACSPDGPEPDGTEDAARAVYEHLVAAALRTLSCPPDRQRIDST